MLKKNLHNCETEQWIGQVRFFSTVNLHFFMWPHRHEIRCARTQNATYLLIEVVSSTTSSESTTRIGDHASEERVAPSRKETNILRWHFFPATCPQESPRNTHKFTMQTDLGSSMQHLCPQWRIHIDIHRILPKPLAVFVW